MGVLLSQLIKLLCFSLCTVFVVMSCNLWFFIVSHLVFCYINLNQTNCPIKIEHPFQVPTSNLWCLYRMFILVCLSNCEIQVQFSNRSWNFKLQKDFYSLHFKVDFDKIIYQQFYLYTLLWNFGPLLKLKFHSQIKTQFKLEDTNLHSKYCV